MASATRSPQSAEALDAQPGASDALLVARAQRDPAAFSPLYDAYFDPIYRYCSYRLGDWQAAEDATSLVFTNALAALPRYRPGERESSFRSWLFAIAHNVISNQHRANRQRASQPLAAAEQVVDAAPSPEDVAMQAEATHAVRAVLAQLAPDQRRIVELRLAGLTDREIATVLGRSHGAIRTSQYRAAQRLRELLDPHREETHHE
ncbi:MAG: sigma-70 family RNA polymerase sigma factor [Thermomicrobiales bacterium]